MEASVLHGLKQGNDVLKEIHKEMNTESVEKLLDETAEARAYQQVRYNMNTISVLWIPIYEQEINDTLANNLTLDDEEAVQEELRQLQALVTLLSVFYLYNVAHSSPLFLSCRRSQNEKHRSYLLFLLPSLCLRLQVCCPVITAVYLGCLCDAVDKEPVVQEPRVAIPA